MEGLSGIKTALRDLIEDELCLGYKQVGSLNCFLKIEKFKFKNEESAENRKEAIKSKILEEENAALEAGCTTVAHLERYKNALFVYGEVPRYNLTDFIRTNKSLNIKLKGALAYGIIGIVNKLHGNGIHHNNISIERFSIHTNGDLCLLSNFNSGENSLKALQPSTVKSVPEEILSKYPRDPYAIDIFKTAVVIDEIFNEEKNYTSKIYVYKKSRKIPDKIFKLLASVLDKRENARFSKPHWLTKKTKSADTSLLLEAFRPYRKHSKDLRNLMVMSYHKRYG